MSFLKGDLTNQAKSRDWDQRCKEYFSCLFPLRTSGAVQCWFADMLWKVYHKEKMCWLFRELTTSLNSHAPQLQNVCFFDGAWPLACEPGTKEKSAIILKLNENEVKKKMTVKVERVVPQRRQRTLGIMLCWPQLKKRALPPRRSARNYFRTDSEHQENLPAT